MRTFAPANCIQIEYPDMDPAVDQIDETLRSIGIKTEKSGRLLLSQASPAQFALNATAACFVASPLVAAGIAYVAELAKLQAKDDYPRIKAAIHASGKKLASLWSIIRATRERQSKGELSFAISTGNACVELDVVDDDTFVDQLARCLSMIEAIDFAATLISDDVYSSMRVSTKLTPEGFALEWLPRGSQTWRIAYFNDCGELLRDEERS